MKSIISKKHIITILITIIFILLFVSCWRQSSREGYKLMSGTEGPISKSDFYVILNECVNNVINHEEVLSTLDDSYTAGTIKVDTTQTDMQNIQNLLKFAKKQDFQIQKMLPNYLLNQDLDGLMDGSLLKPIATDLANKSSHPENPLECDPEAIQKAIRGYQKMVDITIGDDDNSKNKRSMYNSNISMLQAKLVELYASKSSPGNTKCLPPLSKGDAEGILDGYYANALSKVVKSQDLAIDAIKNNIQNNIVDFYSKPLGIGIINPQNANANINQYL